MIEVVAIPKDRVDEIWPAAEPIIAKVLPHNRGAYTTEDVLRDIKEEGSILLLVTEGKTDILATVVGTFEYQGGEKVLHLPIVCGKKLEEWLEPTLDATMNIAKELGCAMVTGRGRRGWLRKLEERGFRELYTVIGIPVSKA